MDPKYTAAAIEIFERYETYLGGERHGNQDRESCVTTIALIIKKHDRLPEFIAEALNSGDGSYRP